MGRYLYSETAQIRPGCRDKSVGQTWVREIASTGIFVL